MQFSFNSTGKLIFQRQVWKGIIEGGGGGSYLFYVIISFMFWRNSDQAIAKLSDKKNETKSVSPGS